jgi:hypothetical protein
MPAPEHPGQHGAHRPRDAEEIGLGHRRDRSVLGVREPPAAPDPRVRHEQVDMAEALLGCGDEPGDGQGIPHVERQREDLRAERAEPLGHREQLLLSPRADRDAKALLREPLGDGGSDAARGAGDERNRPVAFRPRPWLRCNGAAVAGASAPSVLV